MTDRVYAWLQSMEASRRDASRYATVGDAERSKLRVGDEPVLASGAFGDRSIAIDA